MNDGTFAGWRKSSHSGDGNSCIEVADAYGVVGVRDSKQGGRGPVLKFTRAAWTEFTGQAKKNRALCKTGCECRPSGPARAVGAGRTGSNLGGLFA